MREIKFRGKDEQGQWQYGNLVRYTEDDGEQVACIVSTARCEISAELVFVPVDEETVGQYTGLTDKNGREIYEGDIILLESFGQCFLWYDKDRCKFDLRIRLTDGGYIDKLWSLLTDKYEVIGNIYDNPELLNKED